MKSKIKDKWLEALLSGEYTQGFGKMNDGLESFCVLGVLCDIHRKETGREWKKGKHRSSMCYMGAGYGLPKTVQRWAGLNEAAEFGKDKNSNMIYESDEKSQSFKDLAVIIKRYL